MLCIPIFIQKKGAMLKFKTSDYLFITAALLSMALSIYLWFNDQKDAGLFVGLWVPSILGFASYFKTAMRGNNNVG